MDSSILNYNLLGSFEKKEVGDFIEFLLSKRSLSTKQEHSDYKNKIRSVSTWSDEDVAIFEENKGQLNQWQSPTW